MSLQNIMRTVVLVVCVYGLPVMLTDVFIHIPINLNGMRKQGVGKVGYMGHSRSMPILG